MQERQFFESNSEKLTLRSEAVPQMQINFKGLIKHAHHGNYLKFQTFAKSLQGVHEI